MLEREGIGIETGVDLVVIAMRLMLVAHGNSVIWNCTKSSTCMFFLKYKPLFLIRIPYFEGNIRSLLCWDTIVKNSRIT